MAYNITLTNGTSLVTVADGTVDSTNSSITLIGKNYAGYGEFLNENFVKLLENFSNSTPPDHQLAGQLWWNTSTKSLQVYNGTGWKAVSSSTASSSAPTLPNTGDLWWDTGSGQLKVYGGSTWVVIGPSFTATQGQTGAVADIVTDTGTNTSHVIVKFYVNNVVVAVLSKDSAFTTTGLGAGFSTIYPGFNMANSQIGNFAYYGDADNARKLGGVLAANFLRGDQASATNFPLAINNDGGGTPASEALRVGAANDFTVGVNSTSVNVQGTQLGKDVNFYVNVGNVSTKLLTLSAQTSPTASGLMASADPTVPLGVATKQYVDNSLSSSGAVLKRDGSNTITGTIVPDANGTRNFGSASAAFNNIYATTFNGTATNASSLGGIAASNFVRSDTTPGPINGNLTVLKNITVGSSSDFIIDTLSSSSFVNLTDTIAGKGIKLNITNGSGTLTNALTVDGATGLMSVLGNPTAPLGIATKQYVDNIAVGAINLASVSGNIAPATNNTQNIGSASYKWNTVYATTFNGTASTATYADLAERFAADETYLPGTVVELGGVKEITSVIDELSENVFGVISTKAAYLMNAGAGTDATHPPIAMQGRVPVRVVGNVKKGDRLVSAGNGLARAASRSEITPFNVIGRALEDKLTAGEGNIEAIVKLNS